MKREEYPMLRSLCTKGGNTLRLLLKIRTMARPLAVAGVLFSSSFISHSSPLVAADWPQWRGPERTGVSKETGLLPSWPVGGPKLLWTLRDAGVGYSGMAVVGDRLYSMGGDETKDKEYLYAIDLKTQKRLWAVEVGAFFQSYWPGPRGTPTVDGRFLYAVGGYGNLVCVDAATGKKVWSQGMKTSLGGDSKHYGYGESPLVDGDLVIATPGGKKGAIAAFDKKTGKLQWRSAECTYSTAYASIIAIESGGVRQYVQAPNSETIVSEILVGVRASDGKLLWTHPAPKTVATPIYYNGCVYASSMVGCWAIKLIPNGDKFKAVKIYANDEMKNHVGGLVLVGEHLYGYSQGEGVTCQDFKTGEAVWSCEGGGSGSLTYADGNLYCYHDKGDVLLIKANAVSCQQRGRFSIPERSKLCKEGHAFTHPVVANGKLYLRDHELIFCYDVRK